MCFENRIQQANSLDNDRHYLPESCEYSLRSPNNFKDPSGRSDTYQGTYPTYATKVAPILYDYHVPGGYADTYNINPVFIDDSHIPKFSNPPQTRNPTYQGTYPEYFVVADSTGQLRLVPAQMVSAPLNRKPKPQALNPHPKT